MLYYNDIQLRTNNWTLTLAQQLLTAIGLFIFLSLFMSNLKMLIIAKSSHNIEIWINFPGTLEKQLRL